jgi:hypothetical protein
MYGGNKTNIFITGKPQGKKVDGGARYRYENNIQMNVTDVSFEYCNWIALAQD